MTLRISHDSSANIESLNFILVWCTGVATRLPACLHKSRGVQHRREPSVLSVTQVTFIGAAQHLLIVLLILTFVVTLLGGLHLLPAYTARAATTERRGQGEVNVLLGV